MVKRLIILIALISASAYAAPGDQTVVGPLKFQNKGVPLAARPFVNFSGPIRATDSGGKTQIRILDATTSASGAMSAADKNRLDTMPVVHVDQYSPIHDGTKHLISSVYSLGAAQAKWPNAGIDSGNLGVWTIDDAALHEAYYHAALTHSKIAFGGYGYFLSTGLVNTASVPITGQGPWNTTLYTDYNGTLIDIPNDMGIVEELGVIVASGTPGGSQIGINFGNNSAQIRGGYVNKVYFKWNRIAININSLTGGSFRQNYFQLSKVYDVEINNLFNTDQGDNSFSGCVFTDIDNLSTSHIHVTRGSGIRVSDSKIIFGQQGILIDVPVVRPPNTNYESLLEVYGTSFENQTVGNIKLRYADATDDFWRVILDGNEFAPFNAGAYGVDLDNTQQVSISNNVFTNDTTGTALSISNSIDVWISGNQFYNWSTGISVPSNTTGGAIGLNLIDSTVTTPISNSSTTVKTIFDGSFNIANIGAVSGASGTYRTMYFDGNTLTPPGSAGGFGITIDKSASNTADSNFVGTNYVGTGTEGSTIALRTARGNKTTPTASQSEDGLGGVTMRGYGTTGFPATGTAAIFGYASENQTDSAHGSELRLETTPNGSTTRATALTITQDKKIKFSDATTLASANQVPTLADPGGSYAYPVLTNFGASVWNQVPGTTFRWNGTTSTFEIPNVLATGLSSSTLGVGTAAPLGQFEVSTSSTSADRGVISNQTNNGTNGGLLQIYKDRAGAAVQSGDAIGSIKWRAYVGSTNKYQDSAIISTLITAAPTDSAYGPATDMIFNTGSGSAASAERMRITSTGRIQLSNQETAPANNATCTAGQMILDAANGFLYLCTSTNSWKRASFAAY